MLPETWRERPWATDLRKILTKNVFPAKIFAKFCEIKQLFLKICSKILSRKSYRFCPEFSRVSCPARAPHSLNQPTESDHQKSNNCHCKDHRHLDFAPLNNMVVPPARVSALSHKAQRCRDDSDLRDRE